MTVSYADALERAIEAVRSGDGLEEVLAASPLHAERLRADLALIDAASRVPGFLPGPSDHARTAAATRLRAQLAAGRIDSAAASQRRPLHGLIGAFALPRLVLAASGIAGVVLLLWLIQPGGQSSVDAATLEGVVVENEGGRFTIQTLSGLEELSVSPETAVTDLHGAKSSLEGVAVGTVVLVEIRRDGNRAVARRIDQLKADIENWCTDQSDRCLTLAAGLQEAADRCQTEASACRGYLQRIEALRLRAAQIGRLENLKARCRAGGEAACLELAALCISLDASCETLRTPIPPQDSPDGPDRVREITRACQAGDSVACRQLALLCQFSPNLCPSPARLEPTPVPNEQRQLPVATPRPTEARPTVTPAPIRRAEPTSTPARGATATPSDRGFAP